MPRKYWDSMLTLQLANRRQSSYNKVKRSQGSKVEEKAVVVGFGPLLNTLHHSTLTHTQDFQKRTLHGKWTKKWSEAFSVAFVFGPKYIGVRNFVKRIQKFSIRRLSPRTHDEQTSTV